MRRRRNSKQMASDFATNRAKKRLKVGEEGICRIDDIGKDLMFEILVRFPIECLLRLKTVSKYWYRLIGSPEFIKFRLRKACDDPDYAQHKLIFIYGLCSGVVLKQAPVYSTLCIPYYYYRVLTDMSHPMEFWEEESRRSALTFVGSCSGLVCIAGLNNRLIVWNPALRKCKRLPYFGRGDSVFYGFGYDESSDDFKVVGIRNTPKTLVKIYSARNNSWKKLERNGVEVDRVNGHGCLLNGKLHWATNKSIFTIDLSSECFGVIEPPECVRVGEHRDWSIHAVGEFLAVFCYYISNPTAKDADLWMMYGVNESWTRVNKSMDGRALFAAKGNRQIAYLAAEEGYASSHRICVTPSEPGEAWQSIPIPDHMTGNAIMAFLFYCIKLEDYSFKNPLAIHTSLGSTRPPGTVYVESLAWPFQE